MNLLARKTGHSLIRVRVISRGLFCGPALYVEAGVRVHRKMKVGITRANLKSVRFDPSQIFALRALGHFGVGIRQRAEGARSIAEQLSDPEQLLSKKIVASAKNGQLTGF